MENKTKIELNNIYNLPCEVGLQLIQDNAIDLTITSPPYDNIRRYTDVNGNTNITVDYNRVIQELFRITKDGGAIVWVVGDQTKNGSETGTSFKQALKFMEYGFNLHDTMIYEKETQFVANVRYRQNFEYMFVFTKGKIKTFNGIKENKIIKKRKNDIKKRYYYERKKDTLIRRIKEQKNSTTKLRSNIWRYETGFFNSTRDQYAFEHPAIFPEQLVADHIYTWSNEKEIILDPFMGSGTTAKVAQAMNRNYLGFEVNQQYYELALKRIELSKGIFTQ